MVSGGLATSSTVVRRWVASGAVRHHVVDPRSGLPADGPLPDRLRGRRDLCRGQHGEHRRAGARRGAPAWLDSARGDRAPGLHHRIGQDGGHLAALILDGPLLWYVNRASGVVLLALLTLTVLLGVSSMRGAAGTRVPRFAVQALHRNTGLLALVMLGLHIASAVLDEYVDIRWWQGVVPGACATNRPGSRWGWSPAT